MAETTGIAWTRSTFNPWIGCTKIGPGCDNCYAAAQDIRFTKGARWGVGAPRHRTSEPYWRQPYRWNRQAEKTREFWPVFCASQADVFDNEVDPAWRDDLWSVIRDCTSLTWQLVTKRITNVPDMLPPDWGDGWKHVWLLSTTVTQAEFERDWPRLARIPAYRRGLSIEPQIEEIDLSQTTYPRMVPDWVICGGESEQHGVCRPFDLTWAERLRAYCQLAGIAFFQKQMGSRPLYRGRPVQFSGKGADLSEWPEHLRVQQFPNL